MNRRIQYCGVIIGIALTLALLGPGLNLVPVLGAPLMSSASTSVLASGLEGLLGSTVGPDGALYVAQGTTGSISRIDPKTGVVTTFVSGLPQMMQAIGLGGPTDVAFVGRTMYVLVTFVSKDVGGNAIDGIYRFDGSNHFTVIADIGTFNIQPPRLFRFRFLLLAAFCSRWNHMGTVLGHRWAPQPNAIRQIRWENQNCDGVR
jgi:DNA-binding beta-propeller fold protein YncE